MSLEPHEKLKLKIVIMTLFFSIVPLLTLGATIYFQFRTTYTAKTLERIRTLAQNRRGAIELFLEERTAQLIAIAHTHTLAQLSDEAYLEKTFNTLQSRTKSFVDLGVIDNHGNHLAYVGPYYEQVKSANFANEDWFKAVMPSGVYVSDVFMGFRKIPHFVIAVTVREGASTWILRATINSDIVDNIMRQGQIGKGGDAFIIDRKNILLTSPRLSGELFHHPNTPDFSLAVGTSVEEIDLSGQQVLFATSQITNPRWVVVIRQDLQEEMAPLFTARFTGGLVLLGGILLIVVGAILTTGSITNQLIRVEREKAKTDDLLAQSNKMAALGKMAAGIAHEINNPLAIMSEKAGWMKELLEEEEPENMKNFHDLDDCATKIERQVTRCKAITQKMLRFGRQMEPAQELVDVNSVLAEAVSFFENEAQFRQITLETEYGDNMPRITTNVMQLQQVFFNIMNNAVDAVGQGDKVRIKTDFDVVSKNIRIDIADNGPGIPKDIQAKIFDPFFTTKSGQGATGLGLSISFSIMEKLGGRITVASEEGKGTSFTISLPA
jgi:two-component system, NtrC family, sensor kinase